MKQYLLLLKSGDFKKYYPQDNVPAYASNVSSVPVSNFYPIGVGRSSDSEILNLFTQSPANNIWISDSFNLYTNEQFSNFSYFRSRYGLNLVGDRTYVGTEVASPSYSEESTPYSENAIYQTDIGEVVRDSSTPSLIRFIDTTSRIDILSFKYSFTNLVGTVAPTVAVTVFESDSENGPWLKSSVSGDTGVIFIRNAKPFVRLAVEVSGEEIDYSTIGLLFYLEIGIHDPSQKVLSDAARNILKRFPSWTALFEDSVADATPSLAVPESTGGKFINSLVQESLDDFSADVDIQDINAFISSADENMLAWIYISYNVPANINLIYGDSVSLARVSTLRDLLDGFETDYSFFYNPIERQLISLRKYNTLVINSIVYEQEPINIFNDFDEFGARVGLPRLYLENNLNYKKRILDVNKNLPGVTLDAFKRTVRREMDLWRVYGSTPDSDFVGATPEVLEITDIENDSLYFSADGAPLPRFRSLVSDLNTRYPSNIGYIRWGDSYWDYAGLKGEGINRIPAIYDVATPLGDYFQPGVGDFDDALINFRPLDSSTVSFSGAIDIAGFKAVSETNIYTPIKVDYDAYFTYTKTVSDPVANNVGAGFVYEVYLPPHGEYATPTAFYSNINYTNNPDLYVTNNFMSTSSASPEFKLINIFDQDGFSDPEIEFRHKVYGELYENSSNNDNTLSIYDAASVNLVMHRTWNHNTQTYSNLTVGNYKAKFNYSTAPIISGVAPGTVISLATPNLNNIAPNIRIGSNLYNTKPELYSSKTYSNTVNINSINDMSITGATPGKIFLSNIKNSDILPLDATPGNIYINPRNLEDYTLFGEEFSTEAIGGISYNPYDDTEYLIPSSPNILFKEYYNDIQTSTPNFFEHATISYSNPPDYLEVYSFKESNYSQSVFDLMSEAVLWLDPSRSDSGEQIMKNYGTGGSALDAFYGGSVSLGFFDPILLPFNGIKYLYLPGTTGNFAYTPDSSALDITGDIEFIARIKATDWTPGTTEVIASKWQTGTTRSYALYLTSTGALSISTSTNGTTTVTQASSPFNFQNDKTYWIKANLDVNNGSGGRVYSFYYSEDQNTEPTSWILISTHTVSGTTNIFSSTSQLEIGQEGNGTGVGFEGNVYELKIKNGINGTIVFHANFTTGIVNGGTTTFVESSANAATVTIARSTSGYKTACVTRPTLLFGGDDYLEIPDNSLLDFGSTESFSAIVIHRHWQTFGTNDSLMAKKADTTSSTGWALTSAGTTASQMRAIISDGVTQVSSTTQLQRTAGTMHMGTLVRNVTADTVRAFGDNLLTGTTGSDTTTGSLSNSEAVRIGRLSGAGLEYAAMELYGVFLFRRALSTSEIALIYNAYVDSYDLDYFSDHRSISGAGYPLSKTNYEYFEASTTPNIISGFIDQNGNVYKNEEEYNNTFVIGDRYLDSIELSRNSFGLHSTPEYIIDYIKFSATPSSIDLYVQDNDEFMANLNLAIESNSSTIQEVYAFNDEVRTDQFALGIHTGNIYLYDSDLYVYSNPITENYNGKFFEITLSKVPRKAAPIIVKVAGEEYRNIVFEDSATPGKPSFWNTETVLGTYNNSLYLAYENVKNLSITDTFSGRVIFDDLQSTVNYVQPFNTATPSVVDREYEVTYYVNNAFYVDKDHYDEASDSYQSVLYLSSTPSSATPYVITYESNQYDDYMNIDLSINQIDVPIDEGFIYLSRENFDFGYVELYLSPNHISDSTEDIIYLSIVSYDINGNIKPNQTFELTCPQLTVDSSISYYDSGSLSYITTNQYGYARALLRYSGSLPASVSSSIITVNGVTSGQSYSHPNSQTDGYSKQVELNIVRSIGFKLELKAVTSQLVFDADGVSNVAITGRLYWNNKPFRHIVQLGWSKARTLYSLFENTSLTSFYSDSEGNFVIDQITTQNNDDPDQWFARIELLTTINDINQMLIDDGEVIPSFGITIVGDIVYWNERYDNLHYGNEPIPMVSPGFFIKEEDSDIIATPRFVYTHFNSLDIIDTNSTPNWVPPQWVPLRRIDQYQIGLLGSTPNIVSSYTNIHPDSGEE